MLSRCQIPLCAHHPTAQQLCKLCCSKAWEEIFQGILEWAQCLPKAQQPGLPPAANTSPIYDIIWDKLSAPGPRGNTNSSQRIEQHLESSYGRHGLEKQL